MKSKVAEHFRGHAGSVRALLLGVTPELAGAAWRPDIDLVAIDRCQAMITEVWPGDTALRRAECGEWLELPLAPHSRDLVLGDGCFTLLAFPAGYRALAESLRRVLRPGGYLMLRLFCRPPQTEAVEAVFEALLARQIGNFHAFKWRLAMAIQGEDCRRGVALSEIWSTYRARIAEDRELAVHAGFPILEVQTIANYEGVATRYTYSTLEEALEVLSRDFEPIEHWYGSYELAERCPTVVLRRR